MRSNKSLTILGSGYLGNRLAEQAVQSGYEVTAVRRSPHSSKPSLRYISADLYAEPSYRDLPLGGAVVYCLSPSGGDSDSYVRVYQEALGRAIAACQRAGCERFILTSSTSVYDRDDGAVVHENDVTVSEQPNAQALLAGEALLAQHLSGASVRIGGIYGPDRYYFFKRVFAGLELPTVGATQYTNRIHVDDAARAILHLLQVPQLPRSVNLVDTYAAPRNEVIAFLRREMHLPELQPTQEIMPSMLRGNKRVSSKRLQDLGYQYLYPTFESGYRAVLPHFMALPSKV